MAGAMKCKNGVGKDGGVVVGGGDGAAAAASVALAFQHTNFVDLTHVAIVISSNLVSRNLGHYM